MKFTSKSKDRSVPSSEKRRFFPLLPGSSSGDYRTLRTLSLQKQSISGKQMLPMLSLESNKERYRTQSNNRSLCRIESNGSDFNANYSAFFRDHSDSSGGDFSKKRDIQKRRTVLRKIHQKKPKQCMVLYPDEGLKSNKISALSQGLNHPYSRRADCRREDNSFASSNDSIANNSLKGYYWKHILASEIDRRKLSHIQKLVSTFEQGRLTCNNFHQQLCDNTVDLSGLQTNLPLLILDLDETLIHSEVIDNYEPGAVHFTIEDEGVPNRVFVSNFAHS